MHDQVDEAIEVLRNAAIADAAKEAVLPDAAPPAPQTPSCTGMPAPGAAADAPSIAQQNSSNGSADSARSGHGVPYPPSWSASSAPSPHADAPAAAAAAAGRLPPVPYGVPVTLNGPVKGPHVPAAATPPLSEQPREFTEAMAKLDISK